MKKQRLIDSVFWKKNISFFVVLVEAVKDDDFTLQK